MATLFSHLGDSLCFAPIPPDHLAFACRRPTPVDLVPSRYAVRIGDIDAMVVSDGVLPLPTSTMATNADPADLADWLTTCSCRPMRSTGH